MDRFAEDQALGRVIINLQSLEFLLRAFLAHHYKEILGPPNTLTVGSKLLETHWVSYHSLGELIDKFNAIAIRHTISKDIIGVRDALAHGRVFTLLKDDKRTLFKFSKPDRTSARIVRLDYISRLDAKWYESTIEQTIDCIAKVADAAAAHGYKILQE